MLTGVVLAVLVLGIPALLYWYFDVMKKRRLTKIRKTYSYQSLAGNYELWNSLVSEFLTEEKQVPWSRFDKTPIERKVEILVERFGPETKS